MAVSDDASQESPDEASADESDTAELDEQVKLGGEAALHPAKDFFMLAVGPATADEFNTVQQDLKPLACVLLKDSRFEFDSSFVSPRTRTQMKALARLRAERPGAVLSLFGHADPVGDDEYNKKLSGRRAQAIYALIVRRTDLWEDLFSNPAGGDDWGTDAIQIMLQSLGFFEGEAEGNLDAETREAVKQFQAEQGLAVDGQPGKQTRKALFKAYMDAICVDQKDQPFELDPAADFLARGEDKDGKGDYQGCSEFNPVLVFSQAENEAFKKDKDKTARNEANRPNRRVMIFLFPKGARVIPGKWPCPRAKEGTADCRKRFYSDGDQRRAFGPERREYRLTRDTFACRFYDRFARVSPCEAGVEAAPRCHISLILLSNSGCMPLAERPYKITISDDRVLEGTTDKEGFLQHDDVPPGHYTLEIEEHTTSVPAIPVFRTRREHQVPGFLLFTEDDVPPAADEGPNPLEEDPMVAMQERENDASATA